MISLIGEMILDSDIILYILLNLQKTVINTKNRIEI
jgi:hypothetical protein